MADPEFATGRAEGAEARADRPLSAMQTRAVVTSNENDESAVEAEAIRRFLAELTVAPIRNSRLVDVTFASPNPAVAQRAANAIVEAFIQQTSDLRSSATGDAAVFLTQMLDEQRKTVEQSELALQRFREHGDSVSVEDRQNIVVERVGSLNAAVSKARTDRIQKESAYNQMREAESSGAALEAVPAVRETASIQRLNIEIAGLERQKAEMAPRLGRRHPEMVKLTASLEAARARLKEETARIVEATHNEYTAAVDLERAMTEALERQKTEALALNRRGIDYSVLQRDAAMNRQIYEALLQRTKQTGIAEQLKTKTVRIVDRAERPRTPARPNKTQNILVGFVVATVLSLGLILSIEAFDTRIKSPDDLAQRLRLPCLGMVPQSMPTEFDGGELLITDDAPPTFVEAFRALRTGMLFASADRGIRSVLISSTGPGEGKTLVSCNLALALAMAGQRVLLVDADMRKPKVHGMFGCESVPGLSDLLVGGVPADMTGAIRATSRERLWVMPAGTLPPNPPELLGSPQFAEMIRSLGDRFDWLVIDTPPVRAVTDAVVIAHQMTSVAFVVGAGMTDAKAAKIALERLATANARIAGAVLNRVDLRHNSYYYAPYYGRADEQYYVRQPSRT
jgi:capsular exopolysaccharide synthesis family protein